MSINRVTRVAEVLEYLSRRPGGGSLTEVSRELSLAASSCHDLLKSMVEANLLLLGDERRYSVGPRAVRLGLQLVHSLDVDRVSRRHVLELVDRVRQDVYLATRVGDQVMYVAGFPGPQPISLALRLGQPVSLHSTAVGKLFVALDDRLTALVADGPLEARTTKTLVNEAAFRSELATIRERGVSVSREENIQGIVGVAVPVCNSHGDPLAAIAVSALAGDMPASRVPDVVEALRDVAKLIEADLGHGPA